MYVEADGRTVAVVGGGPVYLKVTHVSATHSRYPRWAWSLARVGGRSATLPHLLKYSSSALEDGRGDAGACYHTVTRMLKGFSSTCGSGSYVRGLYSSLCLVL